MLANRYTLTFNAENEIKKASSVPEILAILKKYFDSFYFKPDRAKQSTNYERMNLIFVAGAKRVEEMAGDTNAK